MTTKKKTAAEPKAEKPAPPSKRPKRSVEDLSADRDAALVKLAELKTADPRDPDAVYAQKLVIQEFAAAIAEHDESAE